jgi:hypothetical protein
LRELGRPIGKSTIDKLCMQDEGPPVSAWHGKHSLYEPEKVVEWYDARLTTDRPHPKQKQQAVAAGV